MIHTTVNVPPSEAVGRWLVAEGCDPQRIAEVHQARIHRRRWWAFDADREAIGNCAPDGTFPVLPDGACVTCGCPDHWHHEDDTCVCLGCTGWQGQAS